MNFLLMTQHASVTYHSLGLSATDSSANLTENMLRLLKQLRHTRRNYYLKVTKVCKSFMLHVYFWRANNWGK